MFELERFAGTNDWHVYNFGMGGQNEMVYICKMFGWSLAQFVEEMSEFYNAKLTYMNTNGNPWIYFRWTDEHKADALKFHRELHRKILLNRRLGK